MIRGYLRRMIWFVDNENNISRLVTCPTEVRSGLWVRTVLLIFSLSDIVSTESQYYAFFQCIQVRRTINMVDDKLRCICLSWSTNDEEDHILRSGTTISEQRGVSIRDWFEIEKLETLQDCANVLRANQASAPFPKRVPWLLRLFYRNRIYKDR